jgi:hypothetical protein
MKHEVGMIYQINPEHLKVPCQFIVATEIYEWGLQGYLLIDQPDQGTLVRYNGRAYLRVKWDQIVKVGAAEWLYEPKEEVML